MRIANAEPCRWVAAVAGLIVVVLAAGARGDLVVNQFNDASEVGQWRFDFGGVAQSAAFDPTMDANGNANSGSMKITFGFNSTLADNNKGAYTHDFATPINGANYTGLQMDVRIDPSSAMDAFGNNGFFTLALRNGSGYDWSPQFNDNVTSADGWRHISVSPLSDPANDIRALTLQLYGGPQQNIDGNVTLWIDNLSFISPAQRLPGDANNDGKVGFDDLVILARNYGKNGAVWEDGDFNADGNVGFDDLVILARNYGKMSAAQLNALSPAFRADVEQAFAEVPEPSVAALFFISSAMLLRRRR